MEERKHIDRLFQEKLKDFEAVPSNRVWNNISTQLKQKQSSRKIVPLWYRIAGVAALIAMLVTIGNTLLNSIKNLNSSGSIVSSLPYTPSKLQVIDRSYSETMFNASMLLNQITLETEELGNNQNTQIINNPKIITFAAITESAGPYRSITLSSFNFSDLSIASSEVNEENVETSEVSTNKRSLVEEVALMNTREEDPEIVLPNLRRLQISTVAAPVVYNHFGGGSAIDPRFASNEGSGEVTMSYGLNVAYSISDKVKLRSGISKVDLSYNTQNVAFTIAVNPVALRGVDFTENVNYNVQNGPTGRFSNITASSEFNAASLASPIGGYLNQRIGFIEVPVELEYAIIDKKFGLNFIGGASTMFLDENIISLKANNFSTTLGEANNLNQVSFSTNVGIGLDYNISNQFQLNVEPMFKYQLNTFNTNTNIRPYFFGVYSGFSYKF